MKYRFKKLLKPTTHPIRWSAFFKTHTISLALGLALYFALNFIVTVSFSSQETAIKDVDFSDLYYQVQDKPMLNDSIIIINSGSIANHSLYGRRKGIEKLIRILTGSNDRKPYKIGVDLVYTRWRDTAVDLSLGKLLQEKDCVIAKSKQDTSIFNQVTMGYVNFPDEGKEAIRNYYYSYGNEIPESNKIDTLAILNSFASAFFNETVDTARANEHFFLKYYSKGKGFYNILNKKEEEDTVFAFPAIEADTILKGMTHEELKELFHNKIVLIGILGEGNMHNRYDISDKHKSPTDLEFIFKTPIMPGVVIHANAIRQLQLNEKITDFGLVSYSFLIYGITFYFLYVFLLIDKLKSIYLRFFAEFIFTAVSILLLNYGSYRLMYLDVHLYTFYIAMVIIFVIELKSFALEYYEKSSKLKINTKK